MRALGDAGEPDAACRIAAEAWWLLRDPAPRAARRLNATLHYLTVHPRSTDRKETPMSDKTLDVRTEPPARRHELIFDNYNALGAGEGFVLVNDHDPKPLWYQFEAEHAGAYSWDYLEQGPEVWQVRIGRPAAA
ncbi:MAG TPA: DUF2249 domain-containing protein [Gaiellaceae bacterium]|nr:DUF2249 domain-containing protein [Gaiellaceae bacterium]